MERGFLTESALYFEKSLVKSGRLGCLMSCKGGDHDCWNLGICLIFRKKLIFYAPNLPKIGHFRPDRVSRC